MNWKQPSYKLYWYVPISPGYSIDTLTAAATVTTTPTAAVTSTGTEKHADAGDTAPVGDDYLSKQLKPAL